MLTPTLVSKPLVVAAPSVQYSCGPAVLVRKEDKGGFVGRAVAPGQRVIRRRSRTGFEQGSCRARPGHEWPRTAVEGAIVGGQPTTGGVLDRSTRPGAVGPRRERVARWGRVRGRAARPRSGSASRPGRRRPARCRRGRCACPTTTRPPAGQAGRCARSAPERASGRCGSACRPRRGADGRQRGRPAGRRAVPAPRRRGRSTPHGARSRRVGNERGARFGPTVYAQGSAGGEPPNEGPDSPVLPRPT